MPKPTPDHGPLCGHILSHAPTLTEQQKTILLDALDGLTEADLQAYAARKVELAQIPLDAKGERTVLHLLRKLGAVAGSPAGVLHFNQQTSQQFAHLLETDC